MSTVSTELDRNREIRRISRVGIATNLLLFAFKIAAGILGHSQALIADALHSLTDLGSDMAVLVGISYWSEPPDVKHPYGHGRIETLISLGLAGSLTVAAVLLAGHSIVSLRDESHSVPGQVALVAALVSILVKETLCRWVLRIGRRVESPALRAVAWHHRSDALSSVPPAITVGAALVSPVWSFTDHIGAILVAAMILHAAWQIASSATALLIDRAAPAETVAQIKKVVRGLEDVQCLHAVRTRHLGSGWGVDLHVLVNKDLTVREGHDIAERVKTELQRRGPNITDVLVHIEPFEEPGLTDTHVGLKDTHYFRR